MSLTVISELPRPNVMCTFGAFCRPDTAYFYISTIIETNQATSFYRSVCPKSRPPCTSVSFDHTFPTHLNILNSFTRNKMGITIRLTIIRITPFNNAVSFPIRKKLLKYIRHPKQDLYCFSLQ